MKFRFPMWAVAFLLAALLTTRSATAREAPAAFQKAMAAAGRSVVLVTGTLNPAADAPGGRPSPRFSNTGFFVDDEGTVLTSVLSVAGCREITVASSDGRTAQGRVIGSDQASGLALIKADLSDTVPLPSVEGTPDAGSWLLLACAHHRGGRAATIVRPGVLHATDATLLLNGLQWNDLLAMAVDAPPGSAGAPVIDVDGSLAGVLIAERRTEEGGGECLALAPGALEPILKRLSNGESRRLGWLGMAIVKEAAGREGVAVGAVLEGSPAHQAGIVPGDLLLEIGDEAVDSPEMFMQRVAQSDPGSRMDLKVLHAGRIAAVSVTVAPRPLLIWNAARPRVPVAGPQQATRTDERDRLLEELLRENQLLERRIERLERQLNAMRPSDE